MSSQTPAKRPVSRGHRLLVILCAVGRSLDRYLGCISSRWPGDASQSQQIAFAIGKGIQFAFPILWVMWLAREPLWSSQRSDTGRHVGLTCCAGSGVLILLAMVALYHGLSDRSATLTKPTQKSSRRCKVLAWLHRPPISAGGVLRGHSLGARRILLCWFVFGQLHKLTSFTVAAPLSSLGFMAHHEDR